VRASGARADLRAGEVAPLPWPDAAFDAAVALHSFQFWSDPVAAARELRRVLRAGGRVLLVLRDHGRRAPGWLPNPLSLSGREAAAAAELLRGNGFADVVEREAAGSSRVIEAR
jgi:SAM-dependent methyltransferase